MTTLAPGPAPARSSVAAGGGFARWWVRVYTAGLLPPVRLARIAEIDSDIWEHRRDHYLESDRAPIGLAILSRAVRGMPADILWRFHVEGPKMRISIPFDRLAGALLISLMVFMMVGGSTNYIDTDPTVFRSELARLASEQGESTFETVWAFISGFALIVAAGVFYAGLHRRAQMLAALAAFGLFAGGLLIVLDASLSAVLLQVADDFGTNTATGPDDLVAPARVLALSANAFSLAAFVAVIPSVLLLAVIVIREGLVPRWTRWLAATTAGLFVLTLAAGITDAFNRLGPDDDGLLWPTGAATFVAMFLLLIITGLSLLFSGRGTGSPSQPIDPAAGPGGGGRPSEGPAANQLSASLAAAAASSHPVAVAVVGSLVVLAIAGVALGGTSF
ncbi:MAG: DUF4386 family protein [Tepidiformaceae bacterium]